eukprot:m51a1_g8727 hypothetical protein (915) ;mRNA; f:1049-4265
MERWELLGETRVPELGDLSVLRLRHRATGASVLKLRCSDDVKTWTVGFRTPPRDNTGCSHIAEHAVRNSGSRRFPFTAREALKGSLYVYSNAHTLPDRTEHVWSTRNAQDARNLSAVYLDAVFGSAVPECRAVFLQEAWRASPGASGSGSGCPVTGIVFSEQCGSRVLPLRIASRAVRRALFPGTPYAFDSGGDPEHITELSHEGLAEFFRERYHPSNSCTVVYGDGDLEEELSMVDEALGGFEARQDLADATRLPAPSDAPVPLEGVRRDVFPGAKGETEGYLCVAWNIGDTARLEDQLAASVLARVLVDRVGSPMHEAVVTGGVAKRVTCSVSFDQRWIVFTIVAHNCQTDDQSVARFQNAVDSVIARISEEGMDPCDSISALNWLEFHLRESSAGEVSPQEGLVETQNKRLQEKLADYIASPQRLEEENLLRDWQKKLAESAVSVPRLTLDVVSKEPLDRAEVEVTSIGGVPLVFHRAETCGVVHLSARFHVPDVQPHALGLLESLLRHLPLTDMGRAELASFIDMHSANVSCSSYAIPVRYSSTDTVPIVELSGSCLRHELPYLLRVLSGFATKAVCDQKIARERLVECYTRYGNHIRNMPGAVARGRCLASLSAASEFAQESGGLSFFKSVPADVAALDHFIEQFPSILAAVFSASRLTLCVTTDSLLTEAECGQVSSCFIGTLPAASALPPALRKDDVAAGTSRPWADEALVAATKVSAVARVWKWTSADVPYSASVRVLDRLHVLEYLRRKVRLQGAAYGAHHTTYRSGMVAVSSSRDPDPLSTLTRLSPATLLGDLGSPEALGTLVGGDEGLVSLVISAVGELDRPMGPRSRGSKAFFHYFSGITHEDVRRERGEVLGTTLESLACACRRVYGVPPDAVRTSVYTNASVADKLGFATTDAVLPPLA